VLKSRAFYILQIFDQKMLENPAVSHRVGQGIKILHDCKKICATPQFLLEI